LLANAGYGRSSEKLRKIGKMSEREPSGTSAPQLREAVSRRCSASLLRYARGLGRRYPLARLYAPPGVFLDHEAGAPMRCTPRRRRLSARPEQEGRLRACDARKRSRSLVARASERLVICHDHRLPVSFPLSCERVPRSPGAAYRARAARQRRGGPRLGLLRPYLESVPLACSRAPLYAPPWLRGNARSCCRQHRPFSAKNRR